MGSTASYSVQRCWLAGAMIEIARDCRLSPAE